MVKLLKIFKSKLEARTLSFLLVLYLTNSWGQILIPNTTAVTENFNGMGTTSVTPNSNWEMQRSATPTWVAGTTALNFQFSAGAPASGGFYNWGTTPAVDRALGVMSSGSFASPSSIMAFYQNTNASNLTQLTVSYDAERYRVNSAAASIQFYYSLDGISWVAVVAGDVAAASFPTGANAYTFGTPLVVSIASFNITGLNIVTNGNIYLRWNLNTTGSNSQGIGIDNVSVTAAFTAPANTITTGLVSNPPFALTDCSVTATGTVDFTSSGTFGGPNVYTAQLSNSSGSFASPITIGTLTSNANSGTINITIPAATSSGTGYLIRVLSSSPSVTGSNSSAFTITLTCTSSSTCSVGGAMGSNETNNGCGDGAACFLASIYSAYGNFCSNVNNVGCSSCITAPVSAVYTLPSGCTASIKAEYKNRGTGCTNSAMDGGDQLYITNSGGTLIGQSASLLNSACAGTFATTFTTSSIGSGCGNADGVVTMTLSGGQFTVGGTVNRGDEIVTYTINFSGTCGLNCPTILPISLIDFYGTENGNDNDIFWKVASEENIRSYILEKSEDGINFREFTIQNAKGNGSGGQINYYAQDVDPSEGITYYRLSTLEGGGSWNIKNYKTISIDRNSDDWKSLFYQKDNALFLEFKNSVPKNGTITLFDLSGKLLVDETIKESQTKINTQSFSHGIYFLKIATPYKTDNFKIIIQK